MCQLAIVCCTPIVVLVPRYLEVQQCHDIVYEVFVSAAPPPRHGMNTPKAVTPAPERGRGAALAGVGASGAVEARVTHGQDLAAGRAAGVGLVIES